MFKFSDELVSNNKAYDSYLRTNFDREKIEITRALFIISGLMMVLFFIVDVLSISESFLKVALIRVLMIINLIGMFFLTFKEAFFLKYYQWMLFYAFIVTGSGIIYMIFISSQTELAFKTYFAGLLLVIIAIFPFIYVNTKTLLLFALFLILEYFVVFFFLKGDQSTEHLVLTANNCFFLLGGIGIGLMIELLKKRHLYALFKAENRLKTILMNIDDLRRLKTNNRRDVISFIKSRKMDADLCHTQLCVKAIYVEDTSIVEPLETIVASSMPYKFYIVYFNDNIFIYLYFYESENLSFVQQIEKQINKLFKEQLSNKYKVQTFMGFELTDLDTLLSHDQSTADSNVVTLN